MLAQLLGRVVARAVELGPRETISSSSSLRRASLRASVYDFAIENVSRNVPPRCAVITIMPAVGGPWTMRCHSSVVKSALPVMCVSSRRQFSIVTSVPIGVYGQTFAAAASGSSTQPRLCGVPNELRG